MLSHPETYTVLDLNSESKGGIGFEISGRDATCATIWLSRCPLTEKDIMGRVSNEVLCPLNIHHRSDAVRVRMEIPGRAAGNKAAGDKGSRCGPGDRKGGGVRCTEVDGGATRRKGGDAVHEGRGALCTVREGGTLHRKRGGCTAQKARSHGWPGRRRRNGTVCSGCCSSRP